MSAESDGFGDEWDLTRRGRRRRARRGDQGSQHALWRTPAGRALAAAVVVLAVATGIALALLWPTGEPERRPGQGVPPTVGADVTAVRTVSCGPVDQACRQIVVRVDGERDPQRITLGPVDVAPEVASGDRVRVDPVTLPEGAEAGTEFERFAFRDFDRRTSMLWLAGAFALLAIVMARWRGVFAIFGLVASVALVTEFLVPAILAGSPAIAVSLVGALAVMFLTLVLTYGVGAQTATAALGIAASLLLATLLGALWVHVAQLNGFSSDLATILRQDNKRVSLQGVVIAGMVVGALGVLADTAVSQVSTVMALRRSNPALGPRRLYREAFVVGRDHTSATIHTLVLAYVGASLPLLLVVRSSGMGVTDALNQQDLAEPIVATLVGAIALLAAVPLTTALAAFILARVPVAALPDEHHGHAH